MQREWRFPFPSVQLICHEKCSWCFSKLLCLSATFFWSNATDRKQVGPCVFLVKLSWRCCHGLDPGSLWRGLSVRCLPHQIRFLLFPHWISLRPSCLAKHSWLNVRHEPSCQEKAGGGAAGLGRPQFGISLLFVIHTEKNESRCRSRVRGERKGKRQSSKTRGLSGNRYCRNKSKAIFVKQYMLYTEQPAKWGFNYTNSSHKAQTILLAGLNHNRRGLRTTIFFWLTC